MKRNEENQFSLSRIPDLVSVIIPAFNAENGLRRCIESVMKQKYPHIELIVINDGSTDSTDEIALEYQNSIKYDYQNNQGETAARNRCFFLAKGVFVTFIDHDDYWHEEFVQKCVEFLRSHPAAEAVSTASSHKSALKEEATLMPAELEAIKECSNDGNGIILKNFFLFWANHNHICAGSALLRGSLLDNSGGQRTDLALSGDLEFWAYLATFGLWGFIPEVLLFVDGTQAKIGNLYEKYFNSYNKCPSIESWEERIVSRLNDTDKKTFECIRGRVATWFIFANVFVSRDAEAYIVAKKYRKHLEGKFGALWRLGLVLGWLSWKPLCATLRFRTKLQYRTS